MPISSSITSITAKSVVKCIAILSLKKYIKDAFITTAMNPKDVAITTANLADSGLLAPK
jgi:uncharacterized MnhB-related membrane protein